MIPLLKVFMPDNITKKLSEILNSGQLTYGMHTQDFEVKLRNYVDNSNILTISGNSVFFALKLLDIKDGDEVIVSPMSCLATTQPIAYAGAKTVWTDIDPLTGSLDPEDVKKKITSKTKAIVHYHWSGYPGYIDEINNIGKEYGLKVIDDASESFGAEYKGNKLGNTNSDIVCYSFTPVRLPNAIDGGGLAFKDEDLYKKALLMRDLGIKREIFRDKLGEISNKCDIDMSGSSCMLNNISGYVGACQMDYVNELYSKQRENARKWEVRFQEDKDIQLLGNTKNVNPSYWTFTILSKNRDKLLLNFRNKGYYASKLHLRNDLYSVFQSSTNDFKGVNEFSEKQLNLPCGWWVAEKDIIV